VHAERRRGRTRSRILYWFRTPPGVRVGRAPLDEEAIRLIEQYNADIHFDWPRILKGQGGAGRRSPRTADEPVTEQGPEQSEQVEKAGTADLESEES
jgi:hypothetical protein